MTGLRHFSGSVIDHRFTSARHLRVGLIADTHMPGTIASLWPQVHAAFADVDCILHAGDLHADAVIDELETIAPTYVSCGNGDIGVEHPRLQEYWLGDLAGVSVALVHEFPTPRRATPERLRSKLEARFPGSDPQVVIYGHTHRAEVHWVEQRLYVNPGSATLPDNQSTRLGTVGLLELGGGIARLTLHQLTESGLVEIERFPVAS